MSKLYLTGRSDTRKTAFTSRGRKYIDLTLGYDPDDYSKVISVRLNAPEGKAILWVDGKIVWKED